MDRWENFKKGSAKLNSLSYSLGILWLANIITVLSD